MAKNYQERFFRQMRSFDNLVSLSIGNICGALVKSIRLPSLKQVNLTSCGQTQWIMVNNYGTLSHDFFFIFILEFSFSGKTSLQNHNKMSSYDESYIPNDISPSQNDI